MGALPPIPSTPAPTDVAKGVLTMGQEINRALLDLAEAAPAAAADIAVARQAVEAGLAKFLQSANQGAVATSPTEIGAPFPGGGFSSNPTP